jgi:aminopeptidase N
MTSLFARITSLIALALAISLPATAGAQAEPAFSLADTPGKLPKTVVPLHYAIDLKPNLEKLTIAGNEVVEIEVREPTNRLVLNALNLTVASASLDGVGPASAITADTEAQTATLTFARPIETGRHMLRMAFSSQIAKSGRGLYLVEYGPSDARRRMLASHNEPTDARRIFPGWDEPAFKATFDVTVTVPRSFLAVSNMPVARETTVRGRKRVTFERTPRMSSYLFVLVAGELERLTAEAEGVTVGVVTTRGKSENGRYAVAAAAELLKYFNDYFGVNYPLPKLDLIAVPGNPVGAMENWGGITFSESNLLWDPPKTSPDAQRRIFSILAHEMAHQWFGNLVTMAWWNDLWLNEGFATWMQYKAAEALHPEWQAWLNSGGSKQAAMARDAQRAAHPIQRPVATESEARAVFDTITYSKGQALVRMAETWLGEDTFRAAIRLYMREHAYSNATTADLWRALDAASGKPVGALASAYTEQAGVPLVIADTRCVGEEQRIAISQDRFSMRDPEAKPQSWKVPVTFGAAGAARASDTVLLDGSAEVAAGRCGEAVKLNLGDVGYYRVRYDATMQTALARSLATLPPVDRINLLVDAWALIEAGRSPPSAYFELADAIAGDDRLGWDATAGEANERALLRARLVRALGTLGDEAVIAETRRRFDAYLKDPASLADALRDPVATVIGRNADASMYETLLGLARKATGNDERTRFYMAAASTLDPALAAKILALTLTDELPKGLVDGVISRVAAQGEHRELALAFVKQHFEALAAKVGANFRNTYMSYLMLNFSDRAHAEELKAFAPVHETERGRVLAARNYERIVADADFVAQQLPAIDDWIARRPAR